MPWSLLGIVAAVCALLCAVGFYKFVYFLSIGYGFAVAGGGIAILVMALANPGATPMWILIIQAALFLAYGIRLSGFLLVRELKNITFKKTDVAKDTLAKNGEKKMPVFVLIAIWVVVAALYVTQVSPMLFRVVHGVNELPFTIAGFAVSVGGLILETIADNQKSKQKKERPDMVATKGLYKMCRCPNYLGEIIFWTGVFVSGIPCYKGVGEWIMAVFAYVAIVFIMFNGAQRLEKRQMARYGKDEEYETYANKTPIIIPLLPIYHLNKVEKK